MIFDAETRKNWPPTKTDYEVGARVKVIDLGGNDGGAREYLGWVGTVDYVLADNTFFVGFENDCCGFFPEELRPAEPGEVSAPVPVGVDLTKLSIKAWIIGVMKPGRQ